MPTPEETLARFEYRTKTIRECKERIEKRLAADPNSVKAPLWKYRLEQYEQALIEWERSPAVRQARDKIAKRQATSK